jgi:hypothetical protein
MAGVEEGPREAFGEGEDAKVGVWVGVGNARGRPRDVTDGSRLDGGVESESWKL